MKLENVLVIYTPPSTKEQKSALATVKKALRKNKIRHSLANRDKLHKKYFISKDLVIAVGGDGTFLRAAQFVTGNLLFGVNSEPKNKEGFFMKSSEANFEKKLKNIMKGNFKVMRLPRLEAYINGKKIDALAVNEFFIGQIKSYHAAKYVIQIGNIKERQKSSGILVATPAGSHAWAKSCCNRVLPLDSKSYQFVVRELFEGKVFRNYKLKHRILGRSHKVSIISEMLHGVLIADSVGKEYMFKNGSRAVIKLSDNYLDVVWE
ncbi:NAD(+)/NADH kinase [Candidatus Woesearchaeota archaeon]|nr:NAD(+)/NADH kinase [Candidatus Woesearchaeota archaeon]